jgi:NAD(P)H-binding
MALPSPPKLTLYVRSTSKLPPDIETHARVVIGALGDEESLATAMDGVDTVVSVMVSR